jgi:hypothetical protein
VGVFFLCFQTSAARSVLIHLDCSSRMTDISGKKNYGRLVLLHLQVIRLPCKRGFRLAYFQGERAILALEFSSDHGGK